MTTVCPRCDSQLSQHYATEPPSCVPCGYENYEYPLEQPSRRRNGLMGGLASQLRYIGLANKLMDIIVAVRVERNERAKAGITTVVSCPYDGKDMKPVPKSGYGKNANEQTYSCGRRHRIIVLSSSNGDWRGWM